MAKSDKTQADPADERRQLRESEAKFRALTESASIAVFILQGERFRCVNPAAEVISGYPRHELLEIHFWTLVHPDFRQAVREQWLSRRRGVPLPLRVEAKIVTKAGEEKWLELTAKPIELEGRPAILGTALDISGLKRAGEELRLANETLRAVIQASPVAIVALDLGGCVTLWNPAAERIFGWSEQEAVGKIPPYLRAGQDEEDFRSLLERCRQGEAVAGIERRHRRKDGSDIDINIWTAPVRDAAGRMTGAISVNLDVTERKHLEEQLRQAQKMEAIGQLAGGVAHDFNNLLTVILGYGHMLRSRLDSNEPALADLDEILRDAERAAALTKQLLAFSRRQTVQPKQLDLNVLVTTVDQLLRRVIGEDIDLVISLQPALWPISADPGQIEQVIVNLAVNARDAMPGGGRLSIETANVELGEEYVHAHPEAAQGPHVMLAVSDTGHGMDLETQRRLFEPFFTTKEIGKGTGFGLSTVYGIVKQSGGYIRVYSEPGIGTTFKVYWQRAGERADAVAPAATRLRLGRGTETILLVEDEAGVRRLVRRVLADEGYTVLEAENGPEAIRLAQTHPGSIDLLLTDVVMPQMNGPELAERLRSLQPSVKVLYMSGYTDSAVLQHGFVSSDSFLLQKPFAPDALVRKVREILEAG